MRANVAVLALVLGLSACGGGNGGDDPTVADWLGIKVGNSWAYQVDGTLEGEVEVAKLDPEYVTGVDAYKVEFRVGGFIQLTRWFQIDPDGLFLLGEEAQEGGSVVQRTYLTRIETIPHPLELASGQLKQTWTTESAMDEGGTESHRFDNLGLETITLPAGTYQAYHLVHTRVDTEGYSHQYNLYFTPEKWLPQFDFPEATDWKLSLP